MSEIFYASMPFNADELSDPSSETDDFAQRHGTEAATFEASVELNLVAEEIMANDPTKSYEQALKIAGERRPDLANVAFPRKRVA